MTTRNTQSSISQQVFTSTPEFLRSRCSGTHRVHQGTRCGGFTIIETLIAISILLVAVAAPIVLLGNTLGALNDTKERMFATYLANEGIEIVRHMRDSNLLLLIDSDPSNDPGSWHEGFSTGTCSPQCVVDAAALAKTNSGAVKAVGTVSSTIRKIPFSGGEVWYGHDNTLPGAITSASEDTKFTRTIEIDQYGGNDRIMITVTVQWPDTATTKEVVVRDLVTDLSS